MRFAGKGLMHLAKSLGNNFKSSIGKMPKTELAFMVAPDVVMGTAFGMTTPGDIGDKLLTGLGSGLGGAAGGVGLRAGLGIKNPMLGLATDWGGSMVGDMVGVAGADAVIRARHGGMTPAEKQLLTQQMQTEARIKREAQQELMDKLMLRQKYS